MKDTLLRGAHTPYPTVYFVTPSGSGFLCQFFNSNFNFRPDHCAKMMMTLIMKGESGSVWVCEGGEPIYEVEIPDRLTLNRKM